MFAQSPRHPTATGPAELAFPASTSPRRVELPSRTYDHSPMAYVPPIPGPFPAPPGSSVSSIPGSVPSVTNMPGIVNGSFPQLPQPSGHLMYYSPVAPAPMVTVGAASAPKEPTRAIPIPDPVKPRVASQEHHKEQNGATEMTEEEKRAEKARRARLDTERVAMEESWSNFYKQGWFICALSFLIWMFAGITFYMTFQQWRFFEAMYYTLQAGLSIGFGAPFEDDICERTDIWESNSARWYVSGKYRYDDPSENGRGGCLAGDLSKLFTTLLVLSGSSIAASAVGIIANAIFSRRGGWYKDLLEELTLEDLRKKAEATETIMDDIPILIRIQLRKPLVKAVLSLGAWIGVGILYGMLSHQRMSFLTALYFAVTSVSTAGLEGLKALGEDTDEGAEIEFDEIHQGHFLFVSIYVIVGIPLYAWALTSIASGYVDAMQKKEVRNTMYRPISEEEFKLMSLLGEMKQDDEHPGASEEIDMFEYVECQLLRLNKVSVTDLYEIKRRFRELDNDDSGVITKEELMQTGTVVKGEVDESVERALVELELLRQKILHGERDEAELPKMSATQGQVTANYNQIYNFNRFNH